MPFKKGVSGNPGGKRKGTRSRSSIQLQRALIRLLDQNIDTLSKDFKDMKAKDRASLLISLAKHLTAPALNPERLSEEQLQQVITFLENKRKDEQSKLKG